MGKNWRGKLGSCLGAGSTILIPGLFAAFVLLADQSPAADPPPDRYTIDIWQSQDTCPGAVMLENVLITSWPHQTASPLGGSVLDAFLSCKIRHVRANVAFDQAELDALLQLLGTADPCMDNVACMTEIENQCSGHRGVWWATYNELSVVKRCTGQCNDSNLLRVDCALKKPDPEPLPSPSPSPM